MPVSINNTTLTFNDATTQTTSAVTSISVGTGISTTGGKTPTLTNTGVTSIAAGTGISVSGATGAVTVSSSVTSGQIQTSLATRAAAFNSSGTPLVFNSTGNLTWTAPTGVTRVKVTAIGGGTGINNFGTPNGSGGVGIGVYTVVPGTAYAVTVGAAGAGLTGTSGVPSGGSSSFGSLLTATGGIGGTGGGNGSATLANIINGNATSVRPFGGNSPSTTAGGRSATYDWTISSPGTFGDQTNPYTAPGGNNTGDNYSVSGVVLIEYVG